MRLAADRPTRASLGTTHPQPTKTNNPTPPQAEAIASVTAILGCRTSVARPLLMAYRWDKEKLMSA